MAWYTFRNKERRRQRVRRTRRRRLRQVQQDHYPGRSRPTSPATDVIGGTAVPAGHPGRRPTTCPVFGVRVDIPSADHAPPYQPAGEQNFGFPNNTTLGSNNKGGGTALRLQPCPTPSARPSCAAASTCSRRFRCTVGRPTRTSTTAWSLVNYRLDRPDHRPLQFRTRTTSQGLRSSDITPGVHRDGNCQIDVLDPGLQAADGVEDQPAFDMPSRRGGATRLRRVAALKNKGTPSYLAPNIGTPNGSLPDGRPRLLDQRQPCRCPASTDRKALRLRHRWTRDQDQQRHDPEIITVPRSADQQPTRAVRCVDPVVDCRWSTASPAASASPSPHSKRSQHWLLSS